jgi:hypothetical protein
MLSQAVKEAAIAASAMILVKECFIEYTPVWGRIMQDKLSCRLALNHKTAGENTLAFKFRYTNVRKSFADFC